jgi:hypothetical protein
MLCILSFRLEFYITVAKIVLLPADTHEVIPATPPNAVTFLPEHCEKVGFMLL